MKKLSSEILRQHKGVSFVGVTTTFFCYDSSGEFFLAKRSQNARDEKNRWEVGAGGLKWGVDPLENVRREIKEEYGAKAKKIEFLGYRNMLRKLEDGTPTHWIGLDFAVLVDRKQMKNNEPDMFNEVGWFTLENLPTPMHSQTPGYLKKYKNQLAKILG